MSEEGSGGSDKATERVWALLPPEARAALEHELDASDLRTLLIAVSRARAAGVSPGLLMRRWQEDRYVRPSECDPRQVWRLESRLWDRLPEEFIRLDPSPVAPLGTCSAVAPVHQDRIVTTTRGSEVVSDTTNVLALEAAKRRKRSSGAMVHLAACQRVLRAQPVDGPGLFQHFRLFMLLSSGRDRGSGATESAMLTAHLRFWIDALAVRGRSMVIEFTCFDSPVLRERFQDTVLPGLAPLPDGVKVEEDPERTRARGYYSAGAIRIVGDDLEIGDGGLTDWTARLMPDRKERCFVSCVATERLTQLAPGPA